MRVQDVPFLFFWHRCQNNKNTDIYDDRRTRTGGNVSVRRETVTDNNITDLVSLIGMASVLFLSCCIVWSLLFPPQYTMVVVCFTFPKLGSYFSLCVCRAALPRPSACSVCGRCHSFLFAASPSLVAYVPLPPCPFESYVPVTSHYLTFS